MLDLYRQENPVISVIMATYNRARYLSRSIPSFLNQTYKNSELIVVDDGSDDNTFEVVKAYMNGHDHIRYLKHTNRKLSLSKNAGIKAAIGKYIAFLDSDDEYKPDYLEKRFQYMEANPDVDLVEGGAIIIGDPYVKDRQDMTKKIHLRDCIIGPTIFGKAEVFAQSAGFDKNIFYSEDSYFLEKIKKHFSLKKFDYPSYVYYRDTPGSICNTV